MASDVRVNKGRDSCQVVLTGDIVRRIDARTLETCVSVVAACADQSHPGGQPFAFNDRCISTLAEHLVKDACAPRGFGLAPGVTVTCGHDKLQVTFSGEVARKIDAAVLEGCAKALVACAEANHPLEERFSIDEKCLTTLMEHNVRAHCISQGFGLTSGKRAA